MASYNRYALGILRQIKEFQLMSQALPRCRITPQADYQVAVEIDGTERLRWHYDSKYPRPFFFPFNGPSGISLTRMGHPGAPNHDHHSSVWFAHNKVLGIDFWSNNSPAQIRQKEWLVYEDGDEQCRLAFRLGWYDGHDPKELLEQIVIATVSPGPDNETFLEIQTEFIPTAESLEFQQTNFGFLAVRMARSISEHFGGGTLTNSEGLVGEKDENGKPNIFGKAASWMDYSGPIAPKTTEGVTYHDHPSNPSYPSSWHVREDGWMGCSPGMHTAITTTKKKTLKLRYLLHAHTGGVNAARATQIADDFAKRPKLDVIRSKKPHQSYEVITVSN
jgi:hypothetical protein